MSLGFLLLWDFLSNFLKIENLASSALLDPIADNYQQQWLLGTSYGSQAIKLQMRLIDSSFPDSKLCLFIIIACIVYWKNYVVLPYKILLDGFAKIQANFVSYFEYHYLQRPSWRTIEK